MRRCLILAFLIFGVVAQPAAAAVLDERMHELTFDFSYIDTDDIGSQTLLSVAWLFILSNGYVEVGRELEYFKVELDDFDETFDATAIGPRVDFNFTPANPVTGFLTASFAFFGGDFGDVFDNGIRFGVGLKAFMGDSAAINVILGRETLYAAEDFIDDQDSTFLIAGLSVFFGKR